MAARQTAGAGRIWIVTPVYFDVISWREVRSRLDRALDSDAGHREMERRFVVLDDSAGSDPDIEPIRNLEGVRVVTPPRNLGNQKALVFALRKVLPELREDDIVVTMDADGEDSPEDVPLLLAELGSSSSDPMRVVLARRVGRRRGVFSMRFFYPLYRALFVVLTGVTAATGNFAAFRGATASALLEHPRFDRVYSANLIAGDGFTQTLVPFRKGERIEGLPRISFLQHCQQAIAMLGPFSRRVILRVVIFVLAIAAVLLLLFLVSDRSSTSAGVLPEIQWLPAASGRAG